MGRLALDGMLASKSAGCDILRKGSTNHRRFHSPGGFNAFFFSEQGKDDGKHMTSHMNSLSLFLSISLSLSLSFSMSPTGETCLSQPHAHTNFTLMTSQAN